jgi:hypothetical protein
MKLTQSPASWPIHSRQWPHDELGPLGAFWYSIGIFNGSGANGQTSKGFWSTFMAERPLLTASNALPGTSSGLRS